MSSSQQQQPPPPPPNPPTAPQPPPSQQQQQQQQSANNCTPSPSKRQRVNSVGGENNNSGENDNNDMGFGDDEQYNFDSQGCDWEPSKDMEHSHSLEVNLFGVYCNSSTCANNRVLHRRGPFLWIPSRRIMGSHWKAHKCYPFRMPNARKTVKELTAKQIQLHNQLQQSTQQAVNTIIAAEFPSNCKVLDGKYFYCINCGHFTNRKNNMKAHFGGEKGQMKCNVSHHQREGGLVLEGIHGIQCPRAVVELVRQKQFKLPYPHAAVNQPAPTPTRTTTASTPASRRHYSKFAQFDFLTNVSY
jgi:hypothetical protein